MKPPLFEVGQAITPIKKANEWENADSSCEIPRWGEIYHVTKNVYPCLCGCGYWLINLKEIPGIDAIESGFAPVASDSALTELIEETFIPETA